MHAKRLLILLAILLASSAFYMTIGAKGSWDFILPFRGTKLLAILTVAVAVSTSTLLFQTITQNGILTPSIMGFDALHILIITVMVFFLSGHTVFALGDHWIFLINTSILILAAILLFGSLIFENKADLTRMVLTGVILDTLFRALTSFAVRLIDPNEYAHLQINSYARFNIFEMDLLLISVVAILACLAITWHLRAKFDVIALGHDMAVNLGEDVKRLQLIALGLIAIFVSVSTALVGPVVFLGLLVVSIARFVTPTPYHATLILSAGLISAIILILGQAIIERVLGLTVPLSVIIDFVGGLLFLFLLMRRVKK
jgi:iron complex transport system permease protein